MWRWLAALALATSLAAPLGATAEDRPAIRLKAGETQTLRLGFVAVRIVCDDLKVVRVEDGGDHLRVVGLAAGRTACGFWSQPKHPKPARVYDVVVTAP
jgi:hypothetical protein